MHGMPVVIQSEVYVNSLVLPVPYMMCNLNRLELDDLELNGPYSNLSPDAILPHVEFDTVADRLLGLQLEYHRLLEAAAQMRGHNVSRLTLRLVVQQPLGNLIHTSINQSSNIGTHLTYTPPHTSYWWIGT